MTRASTKPVSFEEQLEKQVEPSPFFLTYQDSAIQIMDKYIVVMGVAGCGKSSLGAALALAEGLPLVEGDDFHSPANRAKMSQGIALTDADRDGWLDILGQQLQAHPGGMVLTCSALKRRYRDRLRQARPGLRFVFLDIEP
jgi:gluconokinase